LHQDGEENNPPPRFPWAQIAVPFPPFHAIKDHGDPITNAFDPGFDLCHWPFCLVVPYCSFNSHVRRGDVDEDRFVEAFSAERASLLWRRRGAESARSSLAAARRR
jgi:hypothetical protein